MNRTRAIFRAWSRGVALVVTAVAFWLAFLSIFPNASGWVTRLPGWGLTAALALVCLAFAAEGQGRWKGFSGLGHPLASPPTWFLGIAGAACLLFLATILPRPGPLPFDPMGWPLVRVLSVVMLASGFGVLLAVGVWRAVYASGPSCGAIERAASVPQSIEQWREWVGTEAPILSPSEDFFELYPLACRTARRLVDFGASQQILGALGGGKSSLKNLVRYELSRLGEGARIRLVEIELWPYETSRAAVARVINAVVEVLGQETNVSSIRGIRSQYLTAMNASGGFYSAAAALLQGRTDPYDALVAADELAQAIDVRLVIWIEDLERFFDGGVSNASPRSAFTREREAHRLNPLRALIHGFERLERISVVTATVSLLSRFDVAKIARYTEELPRLSPSQVGKVLAEFRKAMREQYLRDIDPIPQGHPTDLGKIGDENARSLRRVFRGDSTMELGDALVAHLDTPRKLKHALRLMDDFWRELHGEVDLDDLICFCVLRAGAPDLFAVLRDYYEELVFEQQSGKGGGEFWNRVIDEFSGLEENTLTAFATRIVRRKGTSLRPQGLHAPKYWGRFMKGYLEGPDRDQTVLKAISDQDVDQLVAFLIQGKGESVEQFSYLLAPTLVFDLLSPLARNLVAHRVETWPQRDIFFGSSDPPGLIPLWRIWLERAKQVSSEDEAEFIRVGSVRIVEALRCSLENLPLLSKIEYFFLFNSRENAGFFFAAGMQGGGLAVTSIRAEMWLGLVERFSGNPVDLIRALEGAPAYTLANVVWGSQRVDARDFATPPFPGWERLAPTIVDAAVLDPKLMLLQISMLIVRDKGHQLKRGQVATIYEFDWTLCHALFSRSRELLLTFKANNIDGYEGHPALAAVFDFVRTWEPSEEPAGEE